MSKIAVGDRVCYAKKFLQSTCQLTGDVPRARGKVTELKKFGDNQLATIEWEKPFDCPPKVMTGNLAKVSAARGVEEPN